MIKASDVAPDESAELDGQVDHRDGQNEQIAASSSFFGLVGDRCHDYLDDCVAGRPDMGIKEVLPVLAHIIDFIFGLRCRKDWLLYCLQSIAIRQSILFPILITLVKCEKAEGC